VFIAGLNSDDRWHVGDVMARLQNGQASAKDKSDSEVQASLSFQLVVWDDNFGAKLSFLYYLAMLFHFQRL
jgi:hypothetical protein